MTEPRRRAPRRGEIADRFVVHAASLAPSVHNTQPWHFTSRQGVIGLYADPGRELLEADPAGRELVISCGAALCNLELAIRRLGFAADVRLLPDVTRRDLLAEVRWGRHQPPSPYERSLYESIARRHTRRGPFTAEVAPLLAGELVHAARHRGVGLHAVYDARRRQALADLTSMAEQAQQANWAVAAERARWTRWPGDARPDGIVPAGAGGLPWDGPEFASRDFGHGSGGTLWCPDDPRATGLVALLTTRDDRRPGWLLAGQTLQRLLLHATARGAAAAFHTQALEIPAIRDRIRAEFGGAYPQVLLRIGCGGRAAPSARRLVSDLLQEDGH